MFISLRMLLHPLYFSKRVEEGWKICDILITDQHSRALLSNDFFSFVFQATAQKAKMKRTKIQMLKKLLMN